jgi:catechol 2,3-dioxygenase-like lactoylglutathione lyase family enzyme
MKYHHIGLSVRNLEKSLKFYKEVFGFVEVRRLEREDLGIKAVFLKLNQEDNLHLELIQSSKPIENEDDPFDLRVLGLKHLAFEVDDADKKYRELKEEGYEITEPRAGKSCKKYFFIKDPDGLNMEFFEIL